ncbi:MAG: IMP cyclohydrolase [Dehalococcoidia bacterium]
MDLAAAAAANFSRHLQQNSYPGRGLVIGRAADGASWLQLYWIMGRSENSRNRRFGVEGTTVRTEAVDPSKVADPTNIIYEAMLELPDIYLVSNGDQTRTIADTVAAGGTFEDALATRDREDDAPNYTPRISGMIDLRGGMHGLEPCLALSILRANDADPALSDRLTFRPALPPPGYGFCLTTYESDGSPLPPFRGDPLWLPLDGDEKALLETYWSALDPDNRISLVVKRIPAESGAGVIAVRNRHDA